MKICFIGRLATTHTYSIEIPNRAFQAHCCIKHRTTLSTLKGRTSEVSLYCMGNFLDD